MTLVVPSYSLTPMEEPPHTPSILTARQTNLAHLVT